MNNQEKMLEDLPWMISVDVETAGPNPADYALLSIGACTLMRPRQEFYVEFKPDKKGLDAEAMAVHNLNFAILKKTGVQTTSALKSFSDWLTEAVPQGRRPLFLGFNAPFDWMFVNDYFFHYLGENPFGHSALDIKSFLMGFRRIPWAQTSMRMLTDDPLAHNALADAHSQADIFIDILKSGGLLINN
jgi:DNA polymerase III epsilon subunit-like protein